MYRSSSTLHTDGKTLMEDCTNYWWAARYKQNTHRERTKVPWKPNNRGISLGRKVKFVFRWVYWPLSLSTEPCMPVRPRLSERNMKIKTSILCISNHYEYYVLSPKLILLLWMSWLPVLPEYSIVPLKGTGYPAYQQRTLAGLNDMAKNESYCDMTQH